MRRWLARLSPALHLTRVSTAFAAVANVWFVVLWTRAAAPHEPGTDPLSRWPLWLLLVCSAANALGLFAFATALNDVLDFRRDAALHPERVLPSGRISLDGAITLIAASLVIAVLGATGLGMSAVLLTLLVATAVLFFNAAGKFIPAIGLVVLGLIYAGQMVIPNIALVFFWPVWIVMTHCLLVGAAVHIVGHKRPELSARAVAFAVAGWLFWTGVMTFSGLIRMADPSERAPEPWTLWPEWVSPRAAIAPAVLAVVFVLLAVRRVRKLGRGARAADKIARYGALWLGLYAVGWCAGQGYTTAALILAALSAAGLVGMTLLREAFAVLETPTGYRR